jgi:hypothetical protein
LVKKVFQKFVQGFESRDRSASGEVLRETLKAITNPRPHPTLPRPPSE